MSAVGWGSRWRVAGESVEAHVELLDQAVHALEFERDERSAREFLSMVERDLERFSIADFEREYSIGPLRPEDRG